MKLLRKLEIALLMYLNAVEHSACQSKIALLCVESTVVNFADSMLGSGYSCHPHPVLSTVCAAMLPHRSLMVFSISPFDHVYSSGKPRFHSTLKTETPTRSTIVKLKDNLRVHFLSLISCFWF